MAVTPGTSPGAPVQNSASAENNGVSLDVSRATVNLNRVGNAITSAVGEIAPNTVSPGVSAQGFRYDVLPVIDPGDDGLDVVEITAPAGFGNLLVDGVSVGGLNLGENCPTPGAGEFCATAGASTLSIALGEHVTTTLTPISIDFSADTPTTAGSGDFTATVDDAATSGVSPQAVSAGNADGDAGDENSITVETRIDVIDPDQSSLEVSPPVVIADGMAVSVITATLRDASGRPIAGRTISFSSSRGAADTIIQPSGPTDANGVATGTISSVLAGAAAVTATDFESGVVISDQPEITFTQGQVLSISKRASQQRALTGDIIEYQIEIRNTSSRAVTSVRIADSPPVQFKLVAGSARLDNTPVADPAGVRPAVFELGNIGAFVDANGNGEADPGESGYALLRYRMIVGAGTAPGVYRNTAIATDVCESCVISNSTEAEIRISDDPLFDLGTIIGKVFDDRDGDGWQDRGEPGIPAAMVVLDTGTYALTDRHGRYHFPAVKPGQRLVKINLASIAGKTTATTSRTRVLTVTPALLAKANFGVRYDYETEAIGSEARTGVRLSGEERKPPVVVAGSAIASSVMVNGAQFQLRSREVRMSARDIDDVAELSGNALRAPIQFRFTPGNAGDVESWSLAVEDSEGGTIYRQAGDSSLPAQLSWDGRARQALVIKAGEIYQYYLEVTYADGSRSRSPKRLFGVNRRSVVALDLRGGAFASGSHELTPAAHTLLSEAAESMRQYPDEKILISGHTDSVGSAESNLGLSLRRANAALQYLLDHEELPASRFIIEHYGESRPVANNATPEGRERNRRVEIRGELVNVDRANLNKATRVTPDVRINGENHQADELGRFRARIPDAESVDIVIRGEDGSTGSISVALPTLEILQPTGSRGLPYGQQDNDFALVSGDGKGQDAMLTFRLVGRTEPENVVTIDGADIPVSDDGLFTHRLSTRAGRKVFGVLARNPAGVYRVSNLHVEVTDRDENGPLVVVAAVPELAVQLPPAGLPLTAPKLFIPGLTKPGNRVWVNDQEVMADDAGHFTSLVDLPMGESELRIRVSDGDGNEGGLRRALTRIEQPFFLMALAEGTVSQLTSTGSMAGSDGTDAREIVTEGRVAFYLKGRILGKYLITSAFDSGRNEFGQLFQDLDATDNDRLLTNLDPNTLYPVYGDDSTLVYDTQSQGKFYLALEGEGLNLMVGNYPLNFSDTELSAYQRTLYGIQASYSSGAETEDGESGTQLQVFAAELNQAHVRDELRATGGSLYYLSHNDVIEGSEQVTLLVRDQNNDMVVSRQPQSAGIDYEIRYQEGRVLFNRPVASTQAGDTLINQQLLAGNPVYIQIDYETRLSAFAKTAAGARAKQRFGDHLAVGGTVIRDNTESGEYRLEGLDAEAGLGAHARVLAEAARSRGRESYIYRSDDGGLSYSQYAPGTDSAGQAFKLATELDIGGMIGRPEQLKAGAYYKRLEPGFVSNGNTRDAGTTSMGLDIALRLGERSSVLARHDRRTSLTDSGRSAQTVVRMDHTRAKLKLSAELQDRTQTSGASVGSQSTTAGMSARVDWNERLATTLEHQESIRGMRNSQTSAGMEFNGSDNFMLHARATAGDRGTAAELGARVKLLGKDIHVSERLSTDPGGIRNTSTVFGTSSPFGPDGRIYTEYQWGSLDNYRNLRTLLGVNRDWTVADGLSLMFSGEHSSIEDGQSNSSRFTVAAGIAYDNQQGLSLSSRHEYRRDEGATARTQFMTTNALRYALNTDLALLGKYRYSNTDDALQATGLADFVEASLGIAYRPVMHDRLNLLARYTFLSNDTMQLIDGNTKLPSSSHVLSTDWSYQISRLIEWVGKQAFRIKETELDENEIFTTHTSLSVQRLNVKLPMSLAFGMEYRMMVQREADNSSSGWLTELMWQHPSLLRLGIGFNFTEFSDNEFSDNDYSQYGWFFRIQGSY